MARTESAKKEETKWSGRMGLYLRVAFDCGLGCGPVCSGTVSNVIFSAYMTVYISSGQKNTLIVKFR
jgi:hypothetical protein